LLIRKGRQKLWEGISDCQLKIVCLTEDEDLRARTAESKQRLPQLFCVHSARRTTFSACAVALMVFGRLSEDYHHRCSLSRFLHRLLHLLIFGTLGERRPIAYHWSRICMILYNNGIFRLWRRYSTNFKLTTAMFLTRKIHKQYHSKLSSVVIIVLHCFSYNVRILYPQTQNSDLRSLRIIWYADVVERRNEYYYPFEEGLIQRCAHIQRDI